LEHGINTKFVFEAVKLARESTQTPIVAMTYYNPVYKYGSAKFADEAVDAGIDGVILTDLPPEEADLWLPEATRVGLATIFLLAPTSTKDRIALVADKMTSGFVYCVSRTGVTGARREVPVDLSELLDRIKSSTSLPICVGFGITTPEHVATICGIADGAVIGSALVDFLHANASSESVLQDTRSLVRSWKSATKSKVVQQLI
jgi:tryptophan synthase alpha chain